jgi:hypothetical protein
MGRLIRAAPQYCNRCLRPVATSPFRERGEQELNQRAGIALDLPDL